MGVSGLALAFALILGGGVLAAWAFWVRDVGGGGCAPW